MNPTYMKLISDCRNDKGIIDVIKLTRELIARKTKASLLWPKFPILHVKKISSKKGEFPTEHGVLLITDLFHAGCTNGVIVYILKDDDFIVSKMTLKELKNRKTRLYKDVDSFIGDNWVVD